VSDGGQGVPPDQVGTLFQRFQHTGAAQTREGGSGFGLYMSSKLAVANSGTITYEPGPPHRFVLRTPASAAAADRALS
jgi:two-component system sensor histidine kinase BaeS